MLVTKLKLQHVKFIVFEKIKDRHSLGEKEQPQNLNSFKIQMASNIWGLPMAKQSEFSETFKARQQSNSLEKTFKKCK